METQWEVGRNPMESSDQGGLAAPCPPELASLARCAASSLRPALRYAWQGMHIHGSRWQPLHDYDGTALAVLQRRDPDSHARFLADLRAPAAGVMGDAVVAAGVMGNAVVAAGLMGNAVIADDAAADGACAGGAGADDVSDAILAG